MKSSRLILPFLAALLMIGCGEETKPPTSSVPEQPALTISPELEAAMTAKLDELSGTGHLDVSDPRPPLDSNFDYYAIVFVWGTLHPGDVHIAGGPVIDWSGKMTFNGVGDINPVHPIDFEPWSDTLIADTISGLVEWKSTTLVEFDGIAGLISHDRRIYYIIEPRLTFTTAPFSIELSLDKLDRYRAIFPIDSTNAVAVMAHRIERRVCAHGQFMGQWVREDTTAFKGAMHGLWLNSDGDSVGRYDGKYLVTDSGESIFEGTISGLVTDDIKGHFKGTWWFDDPRMCPSPECGTGHGRFVGKLAYIPAGYVGEIAGEFGDMTGNKAMPMHGAWRVFCQDLNPARSENPTE